MPVMFVEMVHFGLYTTPRSREKRQVSYNNDDNTGLAAVSSTVTRARRGAITKLDWIGPLGTEGS